MIPLTQEEINSIKAEAIEFNRIILYHISRTKCHFEELYDYISRIYNMKALKYIEIEIFSGKSNQIISKDDLRNLKILKGLLFAFMNDNIDSFHISDYI